MQPAAGDVHVSTAGTSGPRTHYLLTYAILAVGVASFALMQSMTVPVLPRIEEQFGSNQSTTTWVLTAYLLSASVFTPIMGRLGDAYGKERMLVFSLLCLSLGSLVAALAPTIGVLIGARVIMGVGGGVLPLSFGIVRDEFPAHRVAGAVSLVSSLMAVGFGAGIVIAGPIVDALGYHWLFWLPFIVTAAAAFGAWKFVPESPVKTPARLPVLPAFLLAGWLVALLIGLSQAPQWGWTSPSVLALVAVALVVAAVWIRVEQRIAVPLIDMRMMRLRGVWTTNLVALLVGFGMYAAFGFLPQLLQTPEATGYGLGSTVTESGLLILPMAASTFICGLIAAPLAVRFGAKSVVVAGCVMAAAGMTLLAGFHNAPTALLGINALMGFGIGLAFSSLAALIIAAVPAEQTGVASGMNANIRTIGGAIGSAVMSTIVTARTDASGLPLEAGYVIGFSVLAAMMLVAAAAGLLIPGLVDRRGSRAVAPEPSPA
jgi:EmrB/QacA subfamily drug resistance transporter